MPRPEVADAVRATCESILNAHGVELVTFSLGGESVGQMLRLTVDRAERAVSLDEIVEISEEISRTLDADDPIPGRYTLEVASAGIERPLVRPTDYRRFEGRLVKVRCQEPIEGQRVYTGTIRSAGEEHLIRKRDDGARAGARRRLQAFSHCCRRRRAGRDRPQEWRGHRLRPGGRGGRGHR